MSVFFHRHSKGEGAPVGDGNASTVQLDTSSLERVFTPPGWLRDLGLLAWIIVGVALVLLALVWLLGLTSTITMPVAVGAILATVAGPLVTKLQQHHVGRGAAAAIVLLALLAVFGLIALLVIGGIYEQSDSIKSALSAAADRIEGWINDAGAGGTSGVKASTEGGTAVTGKSLVDGVVAGIAGLTSLVFFITFSVFSTFFLLKDGPVVRRFIERHMGVDRSVAALIMSNVIRSLRRYFLGVTYVAVFNATVVGIGAVILDVPLAGTIAVVVFVTAYVPFIGAFVSGVFAVLLALASQGTTAALIMLVIVILANGLLQNIVQPIAFGATLDLNPLVVLIVTIGAGALFGMIGMVLAAPLTSAALHIARELAEAKLGEARPEPPDPAPEPMATTAPEPA